MSGTAPAADAPEAVAPPPHHLRFPLFDGLRAIAVMLVLVNHSTGQSIGSFNALTKLLVHTSFGVTIFFLISGFLLYRPFVAHRTGGPPAPAYRAYGKRRILRIVPAYWLCITILLLVPGAIALTTPNVIAQYAFVYTLPFAGSGSCVYAFGSCDLAHTWSLAVEASFYLTLPLYVIAANRIAHGRETWSWVRLELALLFVLSLASLLATFIVFDTTSTSITGGTLIGSGLWFALGMGLAVLSVAAGSDAEEKAAVAFIRRRPGVLWLAAIVLYVALSEYLPATAFIFDSGRQILVFVTFGIAACLLLLPAVFGESGGGLPRRLLANPIVAWIGLVSYGIFLWHNAVIIELTRHAGPFGFVPLTAMSIVITTAIAAASYYLLERPVLRFKNRPLLRRARVASATPHQ